MPERQQPRHPRGKPFDEKNGNESQAKNKNDPTSSETKVGPEKIPIQNTTMAYYSTCRREVKLRVVWSVLWSDMLKPLVILLLALNFTRAADTSPVALTPEETKFKNTLSNCVLNGRWCTTQKGRMTEEYQEKYTVQSASKSGKETWLIHARIQFAGRDLTVPVPVKVKWAGDTPVITMDKISVPGLGTYSARVLIYDDTYAGTWFANDHGGMLHGIIEKPTPPK
jgi:hypothetical protein